MGQRTLCKQSKKFLSNRELRKKCHDLWTAIHKKRHPRCEWCKVNATKDVHHIFTKGAYPAIRFDIDNGICLCRGCHWKVRRKQEEFRDFLIQYRGHDYYEALKTRAMLHKKVDYAMALIILEKIWKEERCLKAK